MQLEKAIQIVEAAAARLLEVAGNSEERDNLLRLSVQLERLKGFAHRDNFDFLIQVAMFFAMGAKKQLEWIEGNSSIEQLIRDAEPYMAQAKEYQDWLRGNDEEE